ncbi:MAG: hypothetical protein EA390_11440 [Balneolaceae bacterium]|nr:MAG: hypothetical protein EA390_11440 [Balneolaceae bacterium]
MMNRNEIFKKRVGCTSGTLAQAKGVGSLALAKQEVEGGSLAQAKWRSGSLHNQEVEGGTLALAKDLFEIL